MLVAAMCLFPLVSWGQSAANVEKVDGNYVWDAVKAVLAERHLDVDVFNESTNRMITVYEEYTAHFMRYRTKYSFELNGGTLVVSLDQKQQQLTSGWGNPQIPSKGADDKMVQQMAQAVKTAYDRIPKTAPAADAAPGASSSTRVVREGVQYDLQGCFREDDKVTCRVSLTNLTANDINQPYDWHVPYVIDDAGIKRGPAGSSLGQKGYGPVLLLPGVATPFEIILDKVGVEVKRFARLQLVGTAADGHAPSAQFSNIAIAEAGSEAAPPAEAASPAPAAIAAFSGKVVRNGVAYELLRCNREDDRVDCRITLTNTTSNDINQGFSCHDPFAIDSAGIKRGADVAQLSGNNYGPVLLVPGIATPLRLVFFKIGVEVKRFPRIQLAGSVQFSNISIVNADEGAPDRTVFRGGVQIQLDRCTRKASALTCSWKLTNQLQADLKVTLRGDATYVIDANGNRIIAAELKVAGADQGDTVLAPGADVPVVATFQGLGSTVTTLVRVELGGNDGVPFSARLANVPVTPAAETKPPARPAKK
jgi:hypothetical protein